MVVFLFFLSSRNSENHDLFSALTLPNYSSRYKFSHIQKSHACHEGFGIKVLSSIFQVYLSLCFEYNFRIRFHFRRKQSLQKLKCTKTVRKEKSLKATITWRSQYRILGYKNCFSVNKMLFFECIYIPLRITKVELFIIYRSSKSRTCQEMFTSDSRSEKKQHRNFKTKSSFVKESTRTWKAISSGQQQCCYKAQRDQSRN